jgi:hypothetical protein
MCTWISLRYMSPKSLMETKTDAQKWMGPEAVFITSYLLAKVFHNSSSFGRMTSEACRAAIIHVLMPSFTFNSICRDYLSESRSSGLVSRQSRWSTIVPGRVTRSADQVRVRFPSNARPAAPCSMYLSGSNSIRRPVRAQKVRGAGRLRGLFVPLRGSFAAVKVGGGE